MARSTTTAVAKPKWNACSTSCPEISAIFISNLNIPILCSAEFYVPVIFYFVLSVVSFGSAVARMRALQEAAHYRSKVVLRLLAYVIALPLCWLGPLVYRFYISSVLPGDRNPHQCESLNNWKSISLNMIGLVNAIIWISSPDFRRTVATRFAMLRCCHSSRKFRQNEDDGDLEEGQELDGQDINQIALVLRNNMLTCSLIGVREGLKRLRMGRRVARTAAAARLAERAPLGAVAGVSITESAIVDVAASDLSADETGSDVDGDDGDLPVVETSVSSSSSASVPSTPAKARDAVYPLRRGHYFGVDTFAVQPQVAAAQNHLDSSQTPLFSSTFVCAVFAPKVFHNLRILSGMGSQDFEDSISPNTFLQGVAMDNDKMSQGGASGAFFAKSPCKRFILKTIPPEEADALLSALPWYYEHLTKYPKSLLCRLLGLYRITTPFNTLHVLVMQNLFAAHPSLKQAAPTRVYDLKGSWIGRRSAVGAVVLKDSDLGSASFQMPAARRLHLIRQLNEDSKLLRDLGLMDYSLLVGVFSSEFADLDKAGLSINSNATYTRPGMHNGKPRNQERIDIIPLNDGKAVLVLGIIDMLQQWDRSKKVESFFKSRIMRKDPKGISAIEPKSYSKRFRSAMARIFQ